MLLAVSQALEAKKAASDRGAKRAKPEEDGGDVDMAGDGGVGAAEGAAATQRADQARVAAARGAISRGTPFS